MFRSLLLAIGHSDYSNVTTRYAVEWARGLSARLTILSVLDHSDRDVIQPFVFPEETLALDFDADQLGEASYERRREEARRTVEKVEKACEDAQVLCRTRIEEGAVSEVILEHALDHDLLVVGQRGSGPEREAGLLGSSIETVVRQVRRPILIVPRAYRPFTNILASYDGSPSATEALHTVAGICDAWPGYVEGCKSGKPCFKLLIVSDDPAHGEALAGRAQSYLSAYRLSKEIVLAQGDPAKMILRAATEHDVDLVVMGAYGHSHVREILLGSTTEHVLRHIEQPLLLAH